MPATLISLAQHAANFQIEDEIQGSAIHVSRASKTRPILHLFGLRVCLHCRGVKRFVLKKATRVCPLEGDEPIKTALM